MKQLSGNLRILVQKAIKKVIVNPLPVNEGGYAKPLGNNRNTHLTGLLKIKLKNAGIRIVYKLIRTKTEMLIIVVGARTDNDVYEAAQHRADKHNL